MTWPAWLIVGLTAWACIDIPLAVAFGRLLARNNRSYPRAG